MSNSLMRVENVVEWTLGKLASLANGELPIMNATSLGPVRKGALPLFDLFEEERAYRLVVDVPGASPSHTRVAWDGLDTLFVHAHRPGGLDWYRAILVAPDADGARARCTLRDGKLTVRIPKRQRLQSPWLASGLLRTRNAACSLGLRRAWRPQTSCPFPEERAS